MDAAKAGDEPYMIACRLKDVPVVVGKNRFLAGTLAMSSFQPDVIVLDDAFQHLKLKRDLDLVLLDHAHPFGNYHLLPRGALREPVSALSRSAACILTRCRTGEKDAYSPATAGLQKLVPNLPVFTSSYVPYWYEIHQGVHHLLEAVPQVRPADELSQIKHRRVFCFSGIARNDDFRHTVKDLGLKVTGFLEFSDHHPYTDKDLATILRCAEETDARRLITTEKDYARFAFKAPLPIGLIVVGVKVTFGDDQHGFGTFIHDHLTSGKA
jgi:tetraacyldisaccharide 4'-kinase